MTTQLLCSKKEYEIKSGDFESKLLIMFNADGSYLTHEIKHHHSLDNTYYNTGDYEDIAKIYNQIMYCLREAKGKDSEEPEHEDHVAWIESRSLNFIGPVSITDTHLLFFDGSEHPIPDDLHEIVELTPQMIKQYTVGLQIMCRLSGMLSFNINEPTSYQQRQTFRELIDSSREIID